MNSEDEHFQDSVTRRMKKEFVNEYGHLSSSELLDKLDELQDFYDFSPVGYLILDMEGRILNANLTAAIMLEVPREEIINQSLYLHIVQEDRDILFFHLRRLFSSHKPQACEVQIPGKKGKSAYVRLDSIIDVDLKDRSTVRMVLSDITEQKQKEAKLQKSEENLRMAVEGANLGTWDRDLLTDNIQWNHILYKLLGRDPKGPAINGETFFEYIHQEDLSRVRVHFEKTLLDGTVFIDEFRIVRDDGEIRWLASSGQLYRDPAGRPVRMAGINLDITDRKHAEETLQKSRDELELRVRERTAELEQRTLELEEEIAKRKKFESQLRTRGQIILKEQNRRKYLSKKLVELLEKERQEIARALHDDIGQMLTSVNMDLESVKSNAGEYASAIVDEIEAIQYRIKKSMENIRDLSRNLRPDILDHLGLVPSIRSMLEGIKKRSNIGCHLFTKDIPEKIAHEKDLTIYRIAQEAVTNCLRHARANNIFVNLIKKGRSIMLTIEDDGIGFEYDDIRLRQSRKERLGIMIMNERTVQAGGEFRVESQVGRGTQVLVEIPMDEIG